MDKSWMSMDRRLSEYSEGVDQFLEFALLNANGSSTFYCPCTRCVNKKRLPLKDVKDHLFIHGICQRYRTWIWHGEEVPSTSGASAPRNIDDDVDRHRFGAVSLENVDDTIEMVRVEQEEMDSDNYDSSSDEDLSSSPHKQGKRKRGPTKLAIGKKRVGTNKKIRIRFNCKGQLVGKTRAEVATDCGRLCKAYVPVSCKGWLKVPKSVKDKIEMELEENYYCKERGDWKKRLLKKIGKLFGDWKSRLYKKYILPNLTCIEKLRDPPARYSTITQEHWIEFVMIRTGVSWAAIRLKYQEIRAQNIYPHTMSRMGYAGLEENMQVEFGTTEPIERHDLWKGGRLKNGEYINVIVKEKAERIDEIKGQVEQGIVQSLGSNDVLTQALGTPEHSGRVRGVGQLVTPKAYFGGLRLTSVLEKQNLELQIMKDYMHKIVSVVQAHGIDLPPMPPQFSSMAEKGSMNSMQGSGIGLDVRMPHVSPSPLETPSPLGTPSLGATVSPLYKGSSTHISLSPLDPPSSTFKERPCKLALGSRDRIVAKGRLLGDVGSSRIVHTMPAPKGSVRVAIDEVIEKYKHELLPIPHRDKNTIREIVGGITSWPEDLVIKKSIVVQGLSQGNERQRDYALMISSFAKFLDRATGEDPSIALDVRTDSDFFISTQTRLSPISTIPTMRDDLLELIEFKEIGSTVIQLCMCVTHRKSKESGCVKQYRFAPPSGSQGCSLEGNSEQLYDCLKDAVEGQLFFYPFNIGCHWVLCVIDPWKREVVYFDPLSNEVHEDVKKIMKFVFLDLGFLKRFKKNKKNVTFKKAMCPRQSESIECGYYVMRYMKDIIESKGDNVADTFPTNECYTQLQLDEVRVAVMTYIRENLGGED